MDTLLFHPLIVHFPIALAVLVPLLSGGVLLSWRAGLLPRRAWWLAAVLQAMLIASSYLASETGEHEEELVESVVPEAALEAHEEAAELFTWATLAPLPLMVLAGIVRREGIGQGVAASSLLASLAVLWLGHSVGEAGGALVYTHGAAAAYTQPAAPAPQHGDDDDDD